MHECCIQHIKKKHDCCARPGGNPLGGAEHVVFMLYILHVVLMHVLNVILMHILDVLIRMRIVDVLLLLLATTLIAPLLWELHYCNNGA